MNTSNNSYNQESCDVFTILNYNLIKCRLQSKVTFLPEPYVKRNLTGSLRRQHLVGRLVARAERDSEQSFFARKRYKELRKLLPKVQRERDVREAQRFKAQSRVEFDARADPAYAEYESGLFDKKKQNPLFTIGAALTVGLVGKLALSVARTAVRVVGKAEKVLDDTNKVTSGVSGLLTAIQNELSRLRATCEEWMGKMWVFPLALLAIWILKRCFNNTIVFGLLTTVFASIFGKKLWEIIFPMTTAEEQSGFDTMAEGLSMLFCTAYMPKKADKLVPELQKRMSNFPRATEGFKAYLKTGMACVEVCLNFVLKRMGKEAIYFGDALDVAVKKWIFQAEEYEGILVKGDPTSEQISKVLTHINDAYILRSHVSDDRLKTSIVRLVDRLETRMRNYAGTADAMKAFRAEPVMVMLVGASKQGKTTMVSELVSFVLIMSGLAKADNVLSEMWQQGETKYHESYHGQAANIMDDCFQEKFKPGMENSEFMQIIRKINNWTHPVNMASVDLKAKVFFQSRIVIGTTNVKSLGSTNIEEVIVCKEAVARRIHHALHMEAAPEFTRVSSDGSKGLDYTKFSAAVVAGRQELEERIRNGYKHTMRDTIASFPWHAWRVRRCEWAFGSGECTVDVDMVDFVCDLAQEIKDRGVSHHTSIDNINGYNKLMESAEDYTAQEQSGFRQDQTSRAREVHNRTSWPWYAMEEELRDAVPFELPTPLVYTEELIKKLKAHVKKYHPDRVAFAERFNLDPTYMSHARVSAVNDFIDNGKAKYEAYMDGFKMYQEAMQFAADEAMNRQSLRQLWVELGRRVMYTMRTSPLFATLVRSCAIIIGTKLIVSAISAIIKLMVSLVGGIFNVFRKVIPGLSDDERKDVVPDTPVEEQSNVKDNVKIKRRHKPWTSKVQEQAYDGSQANSISDIVYSNTYKMIWEKTGEMIGQMIMIKDHMAVMPQHFVKAITKRATEVDPLVVGSGSRILFVKSNEASLVRTMEATEFLRLPKCGIAESDISFVMFPYRQMSPGKDLTKYMFAEEGLNKLVRTRPGVRLDVCSSIKRAGSDTYTNSQQTMYSPYVDLQEELLVGTHKRHDLLRYECPTEVGHCGAPLMVSDPRAFDGKSFIGFHIAGNRDCFRRYGYAAPLTKSMVDDALDYFKPKISDESLNVETGYGITEVSIEEQTALRAVGLVDGSFSLLGKVDTPIHTPPYSKLRKTPIYFEAPMGPFSYRPAHMRAVEVDGVTKYPMVEGLRSYQSEVRDDTPPMLTASVAVATLPFRQATINEPRFILSFEEAVLGLEGLKCKSINRSTSPGYPHVLLSTLPGKKGYFGGSEDFDLSNENCDKLRSQVQEITDHAAKGERLLHLCTDFLKDELRPPHKVDNVQTRIISGSPLDYVLAVRQYFGCFMAACFRHNIDTGLCPGINPYQEWWRLANHLKRGKKTKVFDGDFSRFDASEQPPILWAILDFINEWYDDGETNQLIREVLWLDVVQSRHLTGYDGELSYIVQWSKSLPSGHPLTTIINSWYALISLSIVYADITGNPADMWDHISPATFGDDNITGVSDDMAEVFNQVTVAEAMKRVLHLDYTSGSKDGTLVPYKTLEESTFLKRKFYVNDDGATGGYSAPLAFDSFLFISYYTRNKRDDLELYHRNVESALGELSLHPPQVWSEYFPKFKQTLELIGRVPTYTTRSDYRANTAARDDFWF
jgi:hypothetical protein